MTHGQCNIRIKLILKNMGWIFLISLLVLEKSSADIEPRPGQKRIFWDQVSGSGIFPIEVNVPETVIEMAQGVGQVYSNMQEWWQGVPKPTKVVTSPPERDPPKKKKPTQKPNKKKKPDDRPHKNVIINVMKTANLTIPNTVRSTSKPEAKVTNSQITKKKPDDKLQNNVVINYLKTDNITIPNTVRSTSEPGGKVASQKVPKKKTNTHELPNKDMSHKLKKKKKPTSDSQQVHVVHHYEDHSDINDYHSDIGWDEESEEFARPIKKRKKHKRMKRRKSMKKKVKEEQPGASKFPWPLSMDLNNVVYFFMGLFGVWPGGY